VQLCEILVMKADLLAPLCLVAACLSAPAAAPFVAGDSLPPGALARLGHTRMLCGEDITHLVVSPDGKWLINQDRWFNIATGQREKPPVRIPLGYVLNRFFSDGSYVVRDQGEYQVFSPGADRPRERIVTLGGRVYFDSRGRFCVHVDPGKKDTILRLGELLPDGAGRQWRNLASLEGRPTISFSDNGGLLAWREPRGIAVHDLTTNKRVLLPRVHAMPILTPDGKLVLALQRWELFFFDPRTGRQVRRIDLSHIERVGSELLLTPDGKRAFIRGAPGKVMVVVPLAGRKAPWKFTFSLEEEGIYAAVPMPDSRRVAVVGGSGIIRVHDLDTGKHTDGHSRFPPFVGVQMLDGNGRLPGRRPAAWLSSGTSALAGC
jgi:hypothetical protein